MIYMFDQETIDYIHFLLSEASFLADTLCNTFLKTEFSSLTFAKFSENFAHFLISILSFSSVKAQSITFAFRLVYFDENNKNTIPDFN